MQAFHTLIFIQIVHSFWKRNCVWYLWRCDDHKWIYETKQNSKNALSLARFFIKASRWVDNFFRIYTSSILFYKCILQRKGKKVSRHTSNLGLMNNNKHWPLIMYTLLRITVHPQKLMPLKVLRYITYQSSNRKVQFRTVFLFFLLKMSNWLKLYSL